ncbi:MAG: biopolymer transporter ExbD [Sulfuricellaceae bacterium]|nr:biopolymer transporter ExbD [Sulfuricellaceae bacterium]
MNFQRGKYREEPEINLIPMIDVLLVILIFLMTTTTFSKLSELQINLPQAQADKSSDKTATITVGVDRAGHYAINNTPTEFQTAERFSVELRKAAGGKAEPTVVINADADATHQSVIRIMEAARLAGFNRITFATQGIEP